MVDIGFRRAVVIATVFGYIAVAFLSLVPGDYRPHVPGLPGKVEHLLAYFILGVLTVVADRHRINPFLIGLGLICYSGVLELGQMFVPGRVAALSDFASSSAGAIMGTSIATLLGRRVARI